MDDGRGIRPRLSAIGTPVMSAVQERKIAEQTFEGKDKLDTLI
jgi:hypothetical protein